MCFSATASFTAGTALSAVGVLTLRKPRTQRELPLALIPLLFGIQQLTEGVLWLSLRHDLPTLQLWSTYVFSGFSHVLWPIFVPFAVLLVEANRRRQQALGVFLVLGVGVGVYLLYFLVRFGVTAQIHGQSIVYDSPHFYIWGVLVIYLLATCVSGLFSSHRCINYFGVLAFVLAIAAALVSIHTFVSVWCFFAAVLSALIFLHFTRWMHAMPPVFARQQNVTLPPAGGGSSTPATSPTIAPSA